jgi:hypothetical protein
VLIVALLSSPLQWITLVPQDRRPRSRVVPEGRGRASRIVRAALGLSVADLEQKVNKNLCGSGKCVVCPQLVAHYMLCLGVELAER